MFPLYICVLQVECKTSPLSWRICIRQLQKKLTLRAFGGWYVDLCTNRVLQVTPPDNITIVIKQMNMLYLIWSIDMKIFEFLVPYCWKLRKRSLCVLSQQEIDKSAHNMLCFTLYLHACTLISFSNNEYGSIMAPLKCTLFLGVTMCSRSFRGIFGRLAGQGWKDAQVRLVTADYDPTLVEST